MKNERLFIVAVVLLVAGIGCLVHGWHGTLSISGGIPVSGTTVSLTGATQGGWAAGGIVCSLLGVFVLAMALLNALIGEIVQARR